MSRSDKTLAEDESTRRRLVDSLRSLLGPDKRDQWTDLDIQWLEAALALAERRTVGLAAWQDALRAARVARVPHPGSALHRLDVVEMPVTALLVVDLALSGGLSGASGSHSRSEAELAAEVIFVGGELERRIATYSAKGIPRPVTTAQADMEAETGIGVSKLKEIRARLKAGAPARKK